MTFDTSEIKSPDNKFLKLVRRLRLKKYRDKYKLFIVEGYKDCVEIVKTKARIISVFLSFDFYNGIDRKFIEDIEKHGAKIVKVRDNLFNTISTEETPQGILSVVEKPYYKIEDCIKDTKKVLLILDKIQDPGNLGTIIRTAVAFNISGILLTSGTIDLYNPKVIHATSGFLFNIPILDNVNIKETIRTLSDLNFLILSTDSKEGNDIKKVELKLPLALIIGNEGSGINKEILKLSNDCIKIPISEKVDSLNAAVSAGILIYEIKRRMYEK